MNKLAQTLIEVKKRVAQANPELAQSIDNSMNELKTNPMVNDSQLNPKIESFAKPRTDVSIVDDNGTLHSFSVEIKASKNGPIPDTQLMSKILQAIESQSDSGDVSEMSTGEANKFEVVSFKYERRDDKKNTK